MSRASPKATAAFIAQAVDHIGDTCLLWPFGKMPNGYGQIRWRGKKRLVHAVVCEVVHGARPQGHEVAHKCAARTCVNPAHLRWDTSRGNEADKVINGTVMRGEKNHKTRLTADQVLQVRTNPERKTADFAREFGVSWSTVGDIRRGKNWKWL